MQCTSPAYPDQIVSEVVNLKVNVFLQGKANSVTVYTVSTAIAH